MDIRGWLRPPRHLLALFLLVTLIPGAALVWLGWHLVEQEGVLERQRMQEWLERSADAVTAGLQAEMAAVQSSVISGEKLPAGALRVELGEAGLIAHSGIPLLFTPDSDAARELPSPVWAAAEALEFSARDPAAAAREYRRIAASAPTADIRAGALLRLARTARRLGDLRSALDAYERAAGLGSGSYFGDPAELVARAARCELLDALGDRETLVREAGSLQRDISTGRWRVGRTTYLTYAESVARWTREAPPDARALAVAAAVHALWEESRALRSKLPPSGRRVAVQERVAVLLLWHMRNGNLLLVAAPVDDLAGAWSPRWQTLRLRVDHLVPGTAAAPPSPAAAPAILRGAAMTSLPWDIRIRPAGALEEVTGTAAQRRVLLAGLALLVFLVPAGAFVVARAVRKEIAVARLQKDFVSAVSHELRSPLTAMAHMTEILSSGRVASDDRRREYYAVLTRETDRLKRFVETLLDFGRMESGQLRYAMELHDPAALVAGVVEEFLHDTAARTHPVRFNAAAELPPVLANKEAFARALWNLLDNAAKYSPPQSEIDVDIASDNGTLMIHVRDYGSGVPGHERRRIFQQFVRGEATRAAGVKGTGVGLAMANQVVAAHGGEIRLQSELGRGSTFSIVLPAADAV